jgi:oxalate decarboxylase
MSNQDDVKFSSAAVNRRNFLGIGAGALAVAALTGISAEAQSRETMQKGQQDHSASNPGPVNKLVAEGNPNSEVPPPTDHGDVNPFWYSFDLAHRRVQEGGWTRQVTQRELPDSKDLAGVNMRLTAGSYRELHWHTANEWAYMIYGKARITVLNPDGTIFIDDVEKGDLWFFPAGFPHSIQGLGPDGCEFLLVFDQGLFSEYQTFLISDWVAHTPPSVLAKNFKLPESQLSVLPDDELYIFPGEVPGSLEKDKEAVGGKR